MANVQRTVSTKTSFVTTVTSTVSDINSVGLIDEVGRELRARRAEGFVLAGGDDVIYSCTLTFVKTDNRFKEKVESKV